jgi:3-dehydroquinate dehydratase / shikimate dehydrogenase
MKMICVPVCASSAAAGLELVRRAALAADVVEIRADCFDANQIDRFFRDLAAAPELRSVKLIVTFRAAEQGGTRAVSPADRREFWSRIPGPFWGADLEEDVINDPLSMSVNHKICSIHDFSGVPANSDDIFRRLTETSGDIIKIAFTAADAVGAIPVWKLFQRARREGKSMIPIAMGEAGKWIRILGPAFGAPITYAALEAGKETACGQITVREMADIYRVKELSENTAIYGIVGNPVSHSVSPAMQNAAFKALGLDAVFLPFEVRDLGAFITRMVRASSREIELNLGGLAVTIPHKQAIIPLLDRIDETAMEIGAVNTVKIIGSELHGYNTDADGFISPLKNVYGDLHGARTAVIGAGGAARAVVFALTREQANVTVFARDELKAAEFTEKFKVEVRRLSGHIIFKNFDIVVNATPLGTKGNLESETCAVADQLVDVKFAYDLVYNPASTPFLREARLAGVETVLGRAMLLSQGARQFEIWTGYPAPVDVMMDAAARKLYPGYD